MAVDVQDWPEVGARTLIGNGEVTLQDHDYRREMYFLDSVESDLGYFTWRLGGQCSAIRGLTGLTDGSPPNSRGEILLYVDGDLRWSHSLRPGVAEIIDLELHGALRLRVAFRATTAVEGGRMVLVDTMLDCQPTEPVAVSD